MKCQICGKSSGERDMCRECEAAVTMQAMLDEYRQYAETRKAG